MAKPPSGSQPRRRPVLIAALKILTIFLVFTVSLFLSWPYLVSPAAKIPAADPVQQQIQIQNIITKTKASLVNTLLTGDGRLYLHFSAAELNAVIFQSLSLKLRDSGLTPVRSSTSISGQAVVTDLALSRQGRVLGVHLSALPRPSPNGDLILDVQDIKLGRIPLPRTLAGYYIASRLPAGVHLDGKPLRLTVNPQELIGGNLPPAVKDPRLYVENIFLSDNSLTLATRLAFRLAF